MPSREAGPKSPQGVDSLKFSHFIGAALIASLLSLAQADEVSGPHRMTLSNESWGSLFYVPGEMHNYRYVRNVETGHREMESPLGKVCIAETGIGTYEIRGPKDTIKVEASSSSVKVGFQGHNYEFSREGKRLVVRAPKHNLSFQESNGDMVIEGDFGKTQIRLKQGSYFVTSPRGAYSYVPLEGGGFEVKGGPLRLHPGIYRGATFSTAGVGILVDFKKLDPDNQLFHFLEFEPLLQFR